MLFYICQLRSFFFRKAPSIGISPYSLPVMEKGCEAGRVVLGRGGRVLVGSRGFQGKRRGISGRQQLRKGWSTDN